MKTRRPPLYKHQVECLRLMQGREYFAIFAEMGIGKSAIVINDICHLWTVKQIDRALIIAPKGVIPAWSTELHKHMWDTIPVQYGRWDTAKPDGGLAHLYDPGQANQLKILVMNVEAISTRRGVLAAKEFLVQGPSIIIVDESTTIKTPGTNRSKGAIWLGQMAKYRRIMTGMPIENHILDIYAQCEFLAPGLLDHRSYYSFRSAYCHLMTIKIPHDTGARTVQKVVGYKDLEQLAAKLREFSYRVTKEECLDLPSKIYQTVEVELTPEQKAVYKTMRDKAVVAIGDSNQQSTAVIALTQLLRLDQITCGYLPVDTGEILSIPHNRLATLLSLLEEVSGKVVVWACYKRSIEDISYALRQKYGDESVVEYYGETRHEERTENLARFQSDPSCRFFVATPSTGGLGLTLVAANTVIFYSNSYSVRNRCQAEDRCHRIGQTKSVTYIDLVARQTINEVILESVRAKKELSDMVVDGRWENLL